MDKKGLVFLGGGIILGGGLGLLILYRSLSSVPAGNLGAMNTGRSVDSSAVIGSPAPDFELSDLNGNRVRLGELAGKVVLLNFWATWCLPCKSEMPILDTLDIENRDKLEVLAINFDEPPEMVQEFVSDIGLSLTVLLDPGGIVQELYRVRGYPTTYLLDQAGVVRIHHVGLMTEGQLDKYLMEVGIKQ